jgi:hypothetical protein
MVLAVTDFVHDEKPLWLERNQDGKVLALGESVRSKTEVTAGLYLVLKELTGQKTRGPFTALREFLGDLVESGGEVWAGEFPMALDIDCPDDIRVAESLLEGSQAGTLA